jgi:hypothetical protein
MDLFYSVYTQQTLNKSFDEKELNEVKARVIQMLVQIELFFDEGNKYNIIVADEELRTAMQDFFGNGFSKQRYMAFLNMIKLRPKDYENLIRKDIIRNKVMKLMASSVKLWNYEVENCDKQNKSPNKNDLLFTKMNVILNEWYIKTIRNSKIIVNNDLISKVL